MVLLKNDVFICLDCETTGLDLEKDKIVEIACVKFTFNEILEEFESLVNPEQEVSAASLAIHKIDPSMLQDKPKIDEILPRILDMIGEHKIIGHGIKFDVDLVQKAAERASLTSKLPQAALIDTLRLARLYGDSPNNSLENLARHFNVAIQGSVHRAMTDVKMNIDVFKHLVRRFATMQQLTKILSQPIKMKYMPLGKYKGRLFSEIPLPYLQWASNLEFDQDLHYSIQLELKKRRQGGQFAISSNPFLGL